MGVIFIAIFLIGAGSIYLFWPEAFRDWILKTSLIKPVMWQKIMFTPSYILAFRVGGFVSIVVGGYLIWLYVMK